MKDARNKLEKYLRDEKAKTSNYHKKEKVQEEQLIKLKGRIHILEEQVRSSKGESNAGFNQHGMESASSRAKSGTTPNDRDSERQTSAQLRSNAAIRTGNMHTDSDSLPGVITHSKVASLKYEEEVDTPRDNRAGVYSENHDETHWSSAHEPSDSVNLPILRTSEDNFVADVEDTQFVDIEIHQSSSTQDNLEKEFFTSRAVGQDRSDFPPKPSLPSSQELPVVVSARAVKKRKSCGNIEKQPQPRIKVKVEEIISSSPLGLRALLENDSIDLDDIGDKQMTPRKQRPFVLNKAPSNWLPTSNNTQHPSHGHNLNTKSHTKRNESALLPLNINEQILPRATDDRKPKRRRITSDQAVADLLEDGENIRTTNKLSNNRNQNIDGRLNNLLEKPTPPRRTLAPGAQNFPITDFNQPSARKNDGPLVEALKKPVTKQLDPPLRTDRDIVSLISTRTTIAQKKPATVDSKVEDRESIESPRNPALNGTKYASPKVTKGIPGLTSMTVAQRRSLAAAEIFNAEVDHPSNEPLRSRPLHKLSLADFKINPNYNQGKDYAFTDVVRNKDARRCLQGCTKPDCCGTKFRKLAILMREPDEMLTSSQEEADQTLLEEFLGGNAHMLQNMSTEEREELLLQARTRELANKHGRHRYAYERPKSPVGYWRIDFPTTQEEIEDRKKIKEREREKVEQRYQEAMRPGGAYIFNDE